MLLMHCIVEVCSVTVLSDWFTFDLECDTFAMLCFCTSNVVLCATAQGNPSSARPSILMVVVDFYCLENNNEYY